MDKKFISVRLGFFFLMDWILDLHNLYEFILQLNYKKEEEEEDLYKEPRRLKFFLA